MMIGVVTIAWMVSVSPGSSLRLCPCQRWVAAGRSWLSRIIIEPLKNCDTSR